MRSKWIKKAILEMKDDLLKVNTILEKIKILEKLWGSRKKLSSKVLEKISINADLDTLQVSR